MQEQDRPPPDRFRKKGKTKPYRYRWPGEPEFNESGRRLRLRHPIELKARLAGEQNWRCCYCGRRMDEYNQEEKRFIYATYEHIVAFKDGGADDETNMVICCHSCNFHPNLRRIT